MVLLLVSLLVSIALRVHHNSLSVNLIHVLQHVHRHLDLDAMVSKDFLDIIINYSHTHTNKQRRLIVLKVRQG